MVSEKKKKKNFLFFLSEELCQLSPFILFHRHKRWNISDLPDVLNNPTKIQLTRIRTYNFHLTLFNTPVALKYVQGHWKWHEQVKLDE